jgi:hypothetical protein
MNEASNNTQAAFMEVIAKKIKGQDNKITALQESIKNLPDNTAPLEQLIATIAALNDNINKNRFPFDKMQEFILRLDAGIRILSHPVETKVIHHHHITKLIWITAGLFIILSLVCSGWYITGRKLDSYITNDTKYRYLRINTAEKGLQQYLDRIDSLEQSNIDLREIVLQTEEKNLKNLEQLQKAERLKGNAKELENKARKKK